MDAHLFLPLLTMAGIHLLAVIAPGPNFFVSARSGLAYPRPLALLVTSGVATGTFIQVSLGVIGLLALLAQSTTVYLLLKYMAAGYLVYLGVKALRPSWHPPAVPMPVTSAGLPPPVSPLQAYQTGLITCLTNPKSLIYYFSLFAGLLGPNLTPTVKVAVVLLLPAISWGWYSLVVVSFSLPPFRLGYLRVQRWVDLAFGLLMIALAVEIGLVHR